MACSSHAGPFLDVEVHVLGRAVVKLVPSELGAVPVELEDRLLRLLQRDRLEVEVRRAVQPSAAAKIEVEVLDDVLAFLQMALLDVALDRGGPRPFGAGNVVHRLAQKRVHESLTTGHGHGKVSLNRG